MNIKKYTSYFHDGAMIDIKQSGNKIEISMESNQLRPEWNEDNIPLSREKTIKGILHLENVHSIILDDKIHKTIKMAYDTAILLDFKIFEMNKIKLLIIWMNYSPKEEVSITQFIEVHAEKIYWENIPDLVDPWDI